MIRNSFDWFVLLDPLISVHCFIHFSVVQYNFNKFRLFKILVSVFRNMKCSGRKCEYAKFNVFGQVEHNKPTVLKGVQVQTFSFLPYITTRGAFSRLIDVPWWTCLNMDFNTTTFCQPPFKLPHYRLSRARLTLECVFILHSIIIIISPTSPCSIHSTSGVS